MDFDSTQLLIIFSELDLPSYFSIVPNAGLTSPLTMLGTLAQCNAEFLAAGVLTQMIRPGKAVIYSTLPTVADMRSGAYSPGDRDRHAAYGLRSDGAFLQYSLGRVYRPDECEN
jgi:trimethylamine---corrinoid protein Co-methyltransferase